MCVCELDDAKHERCVRDLELNSTKLYGLMVKIKFISNLHNKYAWYSTKSLDIINDGFKFKSLNLSIFFLEFSYTEDIVCYAPTAMEW